MELLREADDSDDEALVTRVLAVQDTLLRLELPGMEQMLNRASERSAD